jgi:hypothetical protein
MGWPDITNATNERTVIVTAFPRAGVGNQLPLMLLDSNRDPKTITAMSACLSCDLFARHKVDGRHLNYFIYIVL